MQGTIGEQPELPAVEEGARRLGEGASLTPARFSRLMLIGRSRGKYIVRASPTVTTLCALFTRMTQRGSHRSGRGLML